MFVDYIGAMGLEVRDATTGDAASAATLLAELGYPETLEQVVELLESFARDPASRVQVAESSRAVVGLVATHLVPRFDRERLSCRVIDIVVAADHRRCGIGTRLMKTVESEARRGHATRIDLASGNEGSDAHAFYRSLGYQSLSRTFSKRLD